jgi:hypothetical protein
VLTQQLLRRLAADKALMRELLLRVPNCPDLWEKCENDVVEDKIVLWDEPDRDLRIRLRISTAGQSRLAHSHRFSFSNLVLRGSYLHWGYRKLPNFDERTRLDDVSEVMIHEDRQGDCFSIHYSALHSTPFPVPGTVSLVLRGNPVRERAPVMFKEARGREAAARLLDGAGMAASDVEPNQADAGHVFFRVGEKDEPAERRLERRMSRECFDGWCHQLSEWNLV